ncbi:hypothetical protein IM697_24035 [Streptomyces ferrugineus]|uniref:DUF1524 domain-containing protein n=1 Tax=Streptomyces ferrugineus TaxID=1413221 RepID=A0A7M2SAJ6_9ACTN|nr:hypothetical protein [Streptomyces ferrugineus]QOV33304.1 hypothetical protein IM697_24035 [Streptomyces ferrugineus]
MSSRAAVARRRPRPRPLQALETGADPNDGCGTREELLIAEAAKVPEQGSDCRLSGGRRLSYYDEITVTDLPELDVDHMVPLKESWSSGAWKWTDGRREAVTNHLPPTLPWSRSQPGPTGPRG